MNVKRPNTYVMNLYLNFVVFIIKAPFYKKSNTDINLLLSRVFLQHVVSYEKVTKR